MRKILASTKGLGAAVHVKHHSCEWKKLRAAMYWGVELTLTWNLRKQVILLRMGIRTTPDVTSGDGFALTFFGKPGQPSRTSSSR